MIGERLAMRAPVLALLAVVSAGLLAVLGRPSPAQDRAKASGTAAVSSRGLVLAVTGLG